MAKVVMICGKIGSGKTFYANNLMRQGNYVNLSQDEIMLSVFGKDFYYTNPEMHEVYCDKVNEYTQKKAAEIVAAGANVIIENGFWAREERNAYKEFYRSKGVKCELHYIDIDEVTRRKNIEQRNSEIIANGTDFFIVKESDIDHFFETPTYDEIDVRVTRSN